MSNAKSTSKSEPAPSSEAPDPRDVELAELRQRVDMQEAAVGRLQELQADAILWADCPCGQDYRTTSQLTNAVIRNGRLWHDQGHYTYFGARVEQ